MILKRLRLSHAVSIAFMVAMLMFFMAATMGATSPLMSSTEVRPHMPAHSAANVSESVEPI